MPTAPPRPPVLPPAPSRLCGWGGATCSASWVLRPEDVEEIDGVFALARARGLSIGLRGAGQSYGDAALNGDNVSLDLSRLDRILSFDPDTGLVDVEPGVTVRQLWTHVLPSGWWPAFTPGTSCATLGGCAAMNVHGKNHWKAGPMGDYVVAFDLLLPDGSVRRCTRATEPELFHAAIGGFGMLGCFTRLTLQLTRVSAGWVRITPATASDLAAMVGEFEARQGVADFLVGWVDAFATGRALGRGLVHQATFPDPGEEPAPLSMLQAEHQALPTTLLGILPLSIAWRCARPLVNDVGVRCLNRARWRTGRRARPHRQSLTAFSFLLDRVPDWRRAYGPHGLLQYQTLVPASAAAAVYREVLHEVQRAGLRPYMGIFKRHRADAFLMSYGLDGYSLALDFKVTPATLPRLRALTGELDRLIIDGGGSFYFAKDMTLTHTSYTPRRTTARVQRFLALKRAVDPGGLLQTDLFRRVFGPEDAGGS